MVGVGFCWSNPQTLKGGDGCGGGGGGGPNAPPETGYEPFRNRSLEGLVTCWFLEGLVTCCHSKDSAFFFITLEPRVE